jgi:2-keto-4-pentenoate hydratase/2-oxohepta-3-ene-1,7-dioic acid hydratase in catechol pathway
MLWTKGLDRNCWKWLSLSLVVFCLHATAGFAGDVTKYVRFRADQQMSYGVLETGTIHELTGDFYAHASRRSFDRSEVELLAPTHPRHVFGVALNYRSHVGQREAEEDRIPETLQLFHKSPSSVIGPNDEIVIPEGAENVHYESEMVVVIGKKAHDVSVEEADDYILGVTCGNDVSARDWQNQDKQWWRAKGADTFAPVGPYVVSGLNYDQLDIEVRVNGTVKHRSNTSRMARGVEKIVSFTSQYVTLEPGDLIFTGATGITSEIEPGDVVEVEIEGVGVLRNKVVAGE